MTTDPSLLFDTVQTPAGPFSAAVHPDGAVAATAFGGEDALRARLGPVKARRDPGAVRPVLVQVTAFLRGERRGFDVPLRATGSAFQQRVWKALLEIPYGQTRSYGDIARLLGSSARAVGRANATNPICLLVPCHRVIGADGTLTGYAFGEATKRRLLDIEAGA